MNFNLNLFFFSSVVKKGPTHLLLAISASLGTKGFNTRDCNKILQFQNLYHTFQRSRGYTFFTFFFSFSFLHLCHLFCLISVLSVHLPLCTFYTVILVFITALSIHPSIHASIHHPRCSTGCVLVVFIPVTSGVFPGHVPQTASSIWWLPWVLPLYEAPCSLCKLQPFPTCTHTLTGVHTLSRPCISVHTNTWSHAGHRVCTYCTDTCASAWKRTTICCRSSSMQTCAHSHRHTLAQTLHIQYRACLFSYILPGFAGKIVTSLHHWERDR